MNTVPIANYNLGNYYREPSFRSSKAEPTVHHPPVREKSPRASGDDVRIDWSREAPAASLQTAPVTTARSETPEGSGVRDGSNRLTAGPNGTIIMNTGFFQSDGGWVSDHIIIDIAPNFTVTQGSAR